MYERHLKWNNYRILEEGFYIQKIKILRNLLQISPKPQILTFLSLSLKILLLLQNPLWKININFHIYIIDNHLIILRKNNKLHKSNKEE